MINRFISFYRLFSRFIPETRGFGIKRFLLRLSGVSVGKNVRICSSVRIFGSKGSELSIGDNTWIGHESMLAVFDDIIIGNNVNVAPRCYIGTGTHIIDPSGISIAGGGKTLPVKINDGAWICVQSIILPGSIIKEKAIVAAGSTVKGIVQDYEIVGSGLASHVKWISR